MAFKEVFIDRKSCKTYENGIKSQKYLLFFTFSKAVQCDWGLQQASSGPQPYVWHPALNFQTLSKGNKT